LQAQSSSAGPWPSRHPIQLVKLSSRSKSAF
jgi:hypothetical protein